MDKHFLEFWGNAMLAAARGQTSTEALSSWMTGQSQGIEGIGGLFRRFYGLPEAADADQDAWASARDAFETASRAYLDLLQAVPRSEYEALQQRNASLEEKTAEQEALILKLRRELGESLAARGEVTHGFEELVQIQGAEFKKLTDSVGQFFSGKNKKS